MLTVSTLNIMKMAVNLCGLPPKNPKPQSTHEKNMRHIPIEVHSIKYQNNTPQNCQSHQKQEKAQKPDLEVRASSADSRNDQNAR